MNIVCNSETLPDIELIKSFEKAACICIGNEGLDPVNVEISLTFATGDEIRELNRIYRGVDKRTDVLSFPMIEDFDRLEAYEEGVEMCDEDILLGDVVICVDKAREQAKEYGHSEKRELVYLFVHSICHLLGYDHMNDDEKREMRAAEEAVMSELGLEREM